MWKSIKDYEMYEIHPNGSIKRNNKFIKPQIATNGYMNICLCKNGKPKTFRQHRLLAESFLPNKENKPQVNHIDGNKKNNSLDNLEWVTISENMLHAIHVTKTKPAPGPMKGKSGKDHNLSKSFAIEYQDKSVIHYESGLEFQRKTGLDHSSISWARSKNISTYKFIRGKMKGLIVHYELRGSI